MEQGRSIRKPKDLGWSKVRLFPGVTLPEKGEGVKFNIPRDLSLSPGPNFKSRRDSKLGLALLGGLRGFPAFVVKYCGL